MELVCETCGGSGFSDCLIICQKCSSYAIHGYCLGEGKLNDAEVDWHCEYCRLKWPEITSITKENLIANEVKKNNASGIFSLTVNVKRTSNATKNMAAKVIGRRKQRRLILEDEDVDEDVVPPGAGLNVDENKTPEVQSGRNHQNLASLEPDVDYANSVKKFEIRDYTYPESLLRNVDNDLVISLGLEGNVCENISGRPTLNKASNDMPGCPLSEPVWSGSFLIRELQYGEMKAHLSDMACERVSSEARSMPTMLPLRIRQRSDVWPRSFQTSPPHGGNIALYFFSEIAKDGDPFMELLDYLIDSDIALKACLDNSELLLFPSLQLPEPYHCFENRYYIWGIFKNRTSEESPHIVANLGEGRASLPSSDHMPGRINDSVGSLPPRRPFPSLCSPTPDDTEQHGMANSVKNKPESRSEDSITKVEKVQPELGEVQHDTSNCLNLFPLAVEDLAVMVRLGDSGEINLELGLGRQVALKQDGYKDKKPLDCGSLLVS